MSAPRKKSGVWLHLLSTGILDTGSPDEIKTAKREYWKQYHYNHRRAQREEQPEVVIGLARTDGTYERISIAAAKHKMTLAAFIRTAALSYLTQTYIVPDRAFLAHLAQLLSQCANEVQAIAGANEKYFWQREHKIETIDARIERLENEILELFRNPPTLEQQIIKALDQSPETRERLLQLITSYDCKNKIKEKSNLSAAT